jgi:outer membrane protein TolC
MHMFKRSWTATLLTLLLGCEVPRQSIQTIIERQSIALKKLPAEDRVKLMDLENPAALSPEGPALQPGPLDLANAREFALRDNPDIHTVRARLEGALSRISEARAAYFPQVDLVHRSNRSIHTPDQIGRLPAGLTPTPEVTPLPANPTFLDLFAALADRVLRRSAEFSTTDRNSFSDHSSALTANWLLFDSFVREARMLSTKYSYLASAMALADAERLLIQAIDTTYYQIQLGHEEIRIAAADEQFSNEQLIDAQKRFEARKITKADVLNFEVRLRAAQANVVAARGLRDTNEIILAELMGILDVRIPAGVEILPLKDETPEEMTAPDPDEWVATALQARPDLSQAQHIVSAARENITLAKGQYGPELNLRGSWGFEKLSNMAYSEDDQSTAIGIELRWPLFTGGFRNAQLRRARAEWWEAYAALKRKRLEVISDVRRAVIDLVNAQDTAKLRTMNLQSAHENRRIVQTEYAAGKASVVRLNEAQSDFVQADAELTRTRIRLRQAWTDLYAAASTYTQTPADLFDPLAPPSN